MIVIAINMPFAMHYTHILTPPKLVHASGSASNALLTSAGAMMPYWVLCAKRFKPSQQTYHSFSETAHWTRKAVQAYLPYTHALLGVIKT